MFDILSDRLTGIFERLKKRAALGESDVDAAIRDIRIALLEADVALPVVKEFLGKVRERAIGQDVPQEVLGFVHGGTGLARLGGCMKRLGGCLCDWRSIPFDVRGNDVVADHPLHLEEPESLRRQRQIVLTYT